jgi:polyphosphate glucokinase
MKVLGIDIGGSALKGAPVDTRTGELLAERVRVETPEQLTPAAMARVVHDITAGFRWRGPIGIGFPGVIHGSRILTSANLHPDFVGTDGGRLFGKAAGRPVALLNDAMAAGLAEMKFGAGKGFLGKVLILTLGTGVGSMLAYRGYAIPLELGHFPFRGKDAEKVVAASVRKEEDLSWHHWGKRLNEYLQVLEEAIWPERIILGGGVSAKHDKFFKYLHCRAPVKPAQFLNEAGIVGAALWAAQELRRKQPAD